MRLSRWPRRLRSQSRSRRRPTSLRLKTSPSIGRRSRRSPLNRSRRRTYPPRPLRRRSLRPGRAADSGRGRAADSGRRRTRHLRAGGAGTSLQAQIDALAREEGVTETPEPSAAEPPTPEPVQDEAALPPDVSLARPFDAPPEPMTELSPGASPGRASGGSVHPPPVTPEIERLAADQEARISEDEERVEREVEERLRRAERSRPRPRIGRSEPRRRRSS